MLGNVCIRSSRMKEAWPAAPATKHKANVLCFCHLFLGNSSTTATCPKHTPYCSCLHELNTAGRALCSPGNAGATFPCGLPHWKFVCLQQTPAVERTNPANLTLGPAQLYFWEDLQWLQSEAALKHPSIKLALGQQLWRVIHAPVIAMWRDADSSLCWRELQCLVVRLWEMTCILCQDFQICHLAFT